MKQAQFHYEYYNPENHVPGVVHVSRPTLFQQQTQLHQQDILVPGRKNVHEQPLRVKTKVFIRLPSQSS